MKYKTHLVVFSFFFIPATAFAQSSNHDTKMFTELAEQLAGKSCHYQGLLCEKRSMFASLIRRNDKEYCVIDAAQCLSLKAKDNEEVVPLLIEAIKKYHNVDSGDGIIPVRSAIAETLGKTGDPRALDVLKELLKIDDEATMSSTGSFPVGYEPIKGSAKPALKEAIEKIKNNVKN